MTQPDRVCSSCFRQESSVTEASPVCDVCAGYDAMALASDRPSPEDDEDKLDAYGHLNWTVGNEDWLACFDARRTAQGIEYHVVVNCESGGWIDELERGTVPATEEGIENLLHLPGYWAGIAMEHYGDTDEYGPVEWMETAESWAKHLRDLVAAPAPEAEEDAEEQDWDVRTVRSWRP